MYLVEDIKCASPSQISAHEARKRLRDDIEKHAVVSAPKIEPTIIAPVIVPVVEPIIEEPKEPEKLKPEIPLHVQGNAKSLVRIICRFCAIEFNVDDGEIMSRRRTAQVCIARHAAFYVAKKITWWSTPEIGRRFGGKDHTTVIHGLRKVERRIASDPDYAAIIESLKAKVLERLHHKTAVSGFSQCGLPEQQGEGPGAHSVA